MCEHLKGVTELAAAAQALTLACLQRSRRPEHPLNHAYDHAACEPLPPGMTALLELLDQDRPRS